MEILSEIYVSLHVMYPLLSDSNETLFFSTNIREILKYKIFWKSAQWEPSCFMRTDGRADRQTDIMKLIVDFHNFAKAPKRTHIQITFKWLGGRKRTKFVTHHTIKTQSNLVILQRVKSCKKYDAKTKTKRIILLMLRHSVHLLTLYTYPFLLLRSLSPQTVVTNLLVFLSYSFLLVAVWWLSCSCRCLFHCREVRMFVRIVRNVIFLSLWKIRDLWRLEANFSLLRVGAI